jgi:hypothetical protein
MNSVRHSMMLSNVNFDKYLPLGWWTILEDYGWFRNFIHVFRFYAWHGMNVYGNAKTYYLSQNKTSSC